MSAGGSVGFAIIMLGIIVGLMVAQPEMEKAMEDLREARSGMAEEITALKGTDISIKAEHNNTSGQLLVSVSNTGSEAIAASDLDLFVDGIMAAPSSISDSMLYPGSECELTLSVSARPDSIRVVGPYGVTSQLGQGSIIYR